MKEEISVRIQEYCGRVIDFVLIAVFLSLVAGLVILKIGMDNKQIVLPIWKRTE